MAKKKNVTTVKVKAETNQQPEEDAKPVITEDEVKTEPVEEGSQRNRKARLIVRNLSFKAADVNIRKFFKPYGEITDIQILKKPDGRLVGCCFVEFAQKTSAAKAIANTSGKTLLNRPVVVDWAVPKDQFIKKSSKTETEDSEESGFHEDGDDKSKVLDKIKKEDDEDEEEESDDSDDDDIGEEGHGDESEIDDDDQPSEEEDSNESDRDDSEMEDDNEMEGDSEMEDGSEVEGDSEDDSDEESNSKSKISGKPRRESRDISEGCTVFVKNIPFSVDNNEFKKCMKKFGAIYYALICIDPLTEHSKGTGFVKFRSKELAEACLAAGRAGEINLHGSVVETVPALSRDDLQKGSNKTTKRNEPKDTRNLYLVKEGVILAGSPAATGVSTTDMSKRLQLEQWKTQMLKNLNKFVSRNRLVIQNLPPSYDDQKLKALCLKYGGSNPIITEARVMRDLRDIDATGKGRSKGFGFVSFRFHENALQALRALNNNPTIFTPAQRPIVAFSIEDKKVQNIRQKRLEKSKTGILQSQTKRLQQGQSKRLSQKEWEEKQKEEKKQRLQKKKEPAQTNRPAAAETPQPPDNSSSVGQDGKKLSKKERRKLRKQQFLERREKQMQAEKPRTDDTKVNPYMGEQAKEGQAGMMSSRKLREQAQIFKNTRKEQNRAELKRKRRQVANTKIKQPKQAKAKKARVNEPTEDKFSHLEDKYKRQLNSDSTERKRWYD